MKGLRDKTKANPTILNGIFDKALDALLAAAALAQASVAVATPISDQPEAAVSTASTVVLGIVVFGSMEMTKEASTIIKVL